jgi:hypothetical protein
LCSKVPLKNNSSASAKLDNANKRFCSIEDGEVLGNAGLGEVRNPTDCDLTNPNDKPKIQRLVSNISEKMSNFSAWCEDSKRDKTYGDPDEEFMPDKEKLLELRFLLSKINISGDKLNEKYDAFQKAKEQGLIALGVNTEDPSGNTPIKRALGDGRMEDARLLYYAGAELHDEDSYGALDWAVKEEDKEFTADLLNGVDKNAALLSAAQKGHEDRVVLLLKAGADKDAKDDLEQTALHLSAISGQEGCVAALLKAGADKDAKEFIKKTALHKAALWGYEGCVAALLKAGADKNAKDVGGETALDFAKEFGHKGCNKLLVKAVAK